jgi:general secretion pathway protein K
MSDHSAQKGTVLLTTLLVVALMASLAVGMLETLRIAIQRSHNQTSRAQADWYLSGAEVFAESYLQQFIQDRSDRVLNQLLVKQAPVVFPIEGGSISLQIRDGSHCFALSSLTNGNGDAVPRAGRQFSRLLQTLGWPGQQAVQTSAQAMDWADRDGQVSSGGAEDMTYLGKTPAYRAANTGFVSVQELRALQTMREVRFQQMRPFVCVGSQGQKRRVNINTLHSTEAPVLAALFEGDQALAVAKQLIRDRPVSGYTSLEQLRAAPALANRDTKLLVPDQIAYQAQVFWIEAKVELAHTTRFAAFEFVVGKSGNLLQTYRGFGEESLRPAPMVLAAQGAGL